MRWKVCDENIRSLEVNTQCDRMVDVGIDNTPLDPLCLCCHSDLHRLPGGSMSISENSGWYSPARAVTDLP
jgi:hypothetical protein